jgi:hypothetical protein
MTRANSAAANTAALQTVTHPVVTLRDQREGEFVFPTAPQAVRPQATADAAKASGARVTRTKFYADDALIEFVTMHGAAAWKTQKILDFVRAQGHSASMARVNRLLNRDAKGNPLPVEAAKAE